jgi:hypothetical protein
MIGHWHTPKSSDQSSLRAYCSRQTDFGLQRYSG